MASKEQMKKELLGYINVDIDANIEAKIKDELSVLEKTDGINSKNNLESFYELWIDKRSGEPGTSNEINSWLAYAIGMTTKKPESDNFLQERRVFARSGLPDIDTDFESTRRHEVKEYINKKYGDENVSDCGTYMTLTFKSCVTRVGKALDVAGAFSKGEEAYIAQNQIKTREILDSLPKVKGLLKAENKKGERIVVKTLDQAIECFPSFKYYMDQYPDLKTHVKKMEGLVSTYSVHASGICISDTPFNTIAPRRKKSAKTDEVATQYVQQNLEEIGIVKFDCLGLINISFIKRTLDLIKVTLGIDIDLENIALDDKKTYDLYKTGKLTGVFQCGGYGMQNVMREISPDRFNDIAVAISLYRPGPMDSIPEYVARKNGKKYNYIHPSMEKFLKPYLEETYGLLCFQESLLFCCMALASFTTFEGYELIKGVGKKKQDIIDKYKAGFLSGCQKNGIPLDVAERYWEKDIIPFANYGFNKSHAVSYALLSYYTAYLKANYTEEFFVSCLNIFNEQKKMDKVDIILHDMKNFGIKLGTKSVNMCGANYSILRKKNSEELDSESVVSPSLTIKGIGPDTAKDIEKHKPYESLKDLAVKTSNLVTKETIEALFDEGFFNNFIKDYHKKNKVKLDKAKILELYTMYRDDQKKKAAKGIVGKDIFE